MQFVGRRKPTLIRSSAGSLPNLVSSLPPSQLQTNLYSRSLRICTLMTWLKDSKLKTRTSSEVFPRPRGRIGYFQCSGLCVKIGPHTTFTTPSLPSYKQNAEWKSTKAGQVLIQRKTVRPLDSYSSKSSSGAFASFSRTDIRQVHNKIAPKRDTLAASTNQWSGKQDGSYSHSLLDVGGVSFWDSRACKQIHKDTTS